MTYVQLVMMTGLYIVVITQFVLDAIPGNKDITMKHAQFKCNGCKRDTEFLWLEQLEIGEGYKAYQCMSCGAVGVKNIAEALHTPDSDVCRCDKCGSWMFAASDCHTCLLVSSK